MSPSVSQFHGAPRDPTHHPPQVVSGQKSGTTPPRGQPHSLQPCFLPQFDRVRDTRPLSVPRRVAGRVLLCLYVAHVSTVATASVNYMCWMVGCARGKHLFSNLLEAMIVLDAGVASSSELQGSNESCRGKFGCGTYLNRQYAKRESFVLSVLSVCLYRW